MKRSQSLNSLAHFNEGKATPLGKTIYTVTVTDRTFLKGKVVWKKLISTSPRKSDVEELKSALYQQMILHKIQSNNTDSVRLLLTDCYGIGLQRLPQDRLKDVVLKLIKENKFDMLKVLYSKGFDFDTLPEQFYKMILEKIQSNNTDSVRLLLTDCYGIGLQRLPQDRLKDVVLKLIKENKFDMLKVLYSKGFDFDTLPEQFYKMILEKIQSNNTDLVGLLLTDCYGIGLQRLPQNQLNDVVLRLIEENKCDMLAVLNCKGFDFDTLPGGCPGIDDKKKQPGSTEAEVRGISSDKGASSAKKRKLADSRAESTTNISSPGVSERVSLESGDMSMG